MKIPNTESELEGAIARLVSSYMDGMCESVRRAVERGFTRPSANRLSSRRKNEPPSMRKARGSRRSLSELDELCDALCKRVHERPGASMVELAEPLGIDVRALQRPMAKLKSAGRVRSIGRRQGMRYFPAVPGQNEGAAAQAAASSRRSSGAGVLSK